MAFTRVHSGHVVGIRGEIIDVEIDITRGLYAFTIVGLADRITEQARDRVSSAIKNSGLVSPKKKSEKVVVSLAPAHIHKEGSGFDLAIAMGYLLASDDIYFNPADTLFFGELSLDGHIRPAQGILPVVLAAQERGISRIFISRKDADIVVDLVDDITVYGISTLQDLVLFMKGQKKLRPITRKSSSYQSSQIAAFDTNISINANETDPFAEIEGELLAKQAIVTAIAGGHHCILVGTPGSGKTSLAEVAELLQPPLTRAQQIEVATIHSAHQKTTATSPAFLKKSPYRAPHYTSSTSSIMGSIHGGPGEITLAHHGILHMDELALFEKATIEALRTPLESSEIQLAMGRHREMMPCNFTLIATMNPCACGYFGSKIKRCTCGVSTLMRYREKVSGPFMDRIPLCVTMEGKTSLPSTSNSMGTINYRKAIENARAMQRFQNVQNGKAPIEILLKRKNLEAAAKTELLVVANEKHVSSRVIANIIRLATTLTDMEKSNTISVAAIRLALLLSGR